MKRLALFFVLFLMVIALQPAAAGSERAKPPLPPLPSPSVINQVVAETNGANFTPLFAPTALLDRWNAFGGIFAGVTLDVAHAVHYINPKGTLLETVVPVDGLKTAPFTPNITLPNGKGARIIAATYHKSDGVRWAVLVFKDNGHPAKIRLYRTATKFVSLPVYKGVFDDLDGDNEIEDVDAGALISNGRSCVTIRLHQVCWAPENSAEARDLTRPSSKARAAEKAFKQMYDVGVNFDARNSVPDFLGKSQRQSCAVSMSNASSFTQLPNCSANMVIAVAKTFVSGKPIALVVLGVNAEVRAYDPVGNLVGTLPADSYLVMVTPTVSNLPGTPTALFLIGLSGNNFLIPSTIMQGFGTGAVGNKAQAGIRDGFVGYRLFGW